MKILQTLRAYRVLVCLPSAACVLLLQSDLSRGQAPTSGAVAVSAEDQKFILTAASSGFHEVQIAKVGVSRATSPEVKAYSQNILDDHTLSNAEVEALARLKGIALPDPTKTDVSTMKLSSISGMEFDRALVRELIEGHVRDLTAFETEDRSAGSDSDLRSFAHSMLPKLRDHLEQAKSLKP
jgi:putative membrane protein